MKEAKIKDQRTQSNYKNGWKMQTTELFTIYEIEFVNEETGQLINLTTTCGSYKELGKYLTEMSKRSWKMLKMTRKEN